MLLWNTYLTIPTKRQVFGIIWNISVIFVFWLTGTCFCIRIITFTFSTGLLSLYIFFCCISLFRQELCEPLICSKQLFFPNSGHHSRIFSLPKHIRISFKKYSFHPLLVYKVLWKLVKTYYWVGINSEDICHIFIDQYPPT